MNLNSLIYFAALLRTVSMESWDVGRLFTFWFRIYTTNSLLYIESMMLYSNLSSLASFGMSVMPF